MKSDRTVVMSRKADARFARTSARGTNARYGVIAASCWMTGVTCTRISATDATTFGAFAKADSGVEFSG